MLKLIHILILATLIASCSKEKVAPGNVVELYQLKSFQLIQGRCEVNPSTAVLEAAPLVSNHEIISYNKKNYAFKLNENAYQRFNSLEPRTAFAVTVDKQILYYVINMPMYISSTCEHSITSYGADDSKSLVLSLGYPAFYDIDIEDNRNHPLLVSTLKSQGKLK